MLPYHYAPKTELVLINDLSLPLHQSGKIGLIHHSQSDVSKSFDYRILLESTDDYVHAGRQLYESLYKMDKLGLNLIIIEEFPDSGLGRTINDRIARAANRRK